MQCVNRDVLVAGIKRPGTEHKDINESKTDDLVIVGITCIQKVAHHDLGRIDDCRSTEQQPSGAKLQPRDGSYRACRNGKETRAASGAHLNSRLGSHSVTAGT